VGVYVYIIIEKIDGIFHQNTERINEHNITPNKRNDDKGETRKTRVE
jgi:hypothetical protein